MKTKQPENQVALITKPVGLPKGRRRVREEYTWSGGTWVMTNEVRYVYEGRRVLQERDANNTPLVTYTRGTDLSDTFGGAGGIGGLLARSDASGHYYYHYDGNGNVVALVNSNAEVVARYRYDPYGNLLAMSGPMASKNLYRFSSKEWHPNSGLYYYGYRYYEPNFQRWLSQDPIGEYGGINIFEFVGNNPLGAVDALGLDFSTWCGAGPGYSGWTQDKREMPSFGKDPNLDRALGWMKKHYPGLAPKHALVSYALPSLGWTGFGVPNSRLFGGVIVVAPGQAVDEYISIIAHEGLHTKYGPAWGKLHAVFEDVAYQIKLDYWLEEAGKKQCGVHSWP